MQARASIRKRRLQRAQYFVRRRLLHEAQQPIQWNEVRNRLSKPQRKEIDSAAVAMAMEALAELEVGTFERGPRGAGSYRATGPLP